MSISCRRTAAAIALAVVVILPGLLAQASPVHAATTLNVRAGSGEPGFAVNLFLPDAVTVRAGDTVRWTFQWIEPHTVTFGTPKGDPTQPTQPPGSVPEYSGSEYFSSGLIASGATFDMKFTKEGTYSYLCAIHPFMTGKITVAGADAALETQGEVNSRSVNAYNTAITALKGVAASLGAAPVAVTPNATGGKKYTVAVAGETLGGDVQQFFPVAASITTKDSIEWKSSVHTPHFVNLGAPPPGFADPFAAAVARPASAYTGTGWVNSGALGIDWPGGLSFEMTFAKPGSYPYYCIIHADQGMTGIVNVSQAAPAPPNTGSGLATSAKRQPAIGGWLLVLGAIALAAATATAGVCAVRRQ